jgi:hypothetical protein
MSVRSLVALVLVALLWSAAPAQARAQHERCPRDVVEQNAFAKLYIRTSEDFYNELVACVKATRRRIVLAGWFAQGSSTDDPSPQHWLSGRFVAVNQASCPGDPTSTAQCTGNLRVINLRTRKRHATVATGDPISDLVITLRGSVGLIHRNELITAVGTDVQVLDRQAEQGSVAYAENARRLYWTTSTGEPRSTRLR